MDIGLEYSTLPLTVGNPVVKYAEIYSVTRRQVLVRRPHRRHPFNNGKNTRVLVGVPGRTGCMHA
jgi:hypothetical protein